MCKSVIVIYLDYAKKYGLHVNKEIIILYPDDNSLKHSLSLLVLFFFFIWIFLLISLFHSCFCWNYNEIYFTIYLILLLSFKFISTHIAKLPRRLSMFRCECIPRICAIISWKALTIFIGDMWKVWWRFYSNFQIDIQNMWSIRYTIYESLVNIHRQMNYILFDNVIGSILTLARHM